ncbi:hypothetical protein R2F61_07950 [Mollicutes bacterium LVI A0078]|nr:hypothetical protein RZE84_07725 [Mollicutes bacterium LVI A0075]WOO90647.1 hypothetical protein R2F61_07950 [Mollicutes bacterium LVI A0078]
MKMTMKLATDLWTIKEVNNFEEKPINAIDTLKLEKLDSIFNKLAEERNLRIMSAIYEQSETEEYQYAPELIEEETNNYNENYEKLVNYLKDHEITYDEEMLRTLTLDTSMKSELNSYIQNLDNTSMLLKREIYKIIKGF